MTDFKQAIEDQMSGLQHIIEQPSRDGRWFDVVLLDIPDNPPRLARYFIAALGRSMAQECNHPTEARVTNLESQHGQMVKVSIWCEPGHSYEWVGDWFMNHPELKKRFRTCD